MQDEARLRRESESSLAQSKVASGGGGSFTIDLIVTKAVVCCDTSNIQGKLTVIDRVMRSYIDCRFMLRVRGGEYSFQSSKYSWACYSSEPCMTR